MALSRAELEARRAWIGSSDVPAILGMDKYRSPRDVWEDKLGMTEIDEATSDAAELGNRLEPVMVTWARDRLAEATGRDLALELNRRFVHDNGIFSAQCDGWLPDLAEPIEAKSHGLLNAMWKDDGDWGPTGTDDIPMRTLAQVNFSMLVTGAGRAHVAALLGRGLGPRFYLVHRNEGIIREVFERCEEFWTVNVLQGIPPEGMPGLNTVERRIREAGKIASVDPELAERYRLILDQEALLRQAKEEVRTEALHQMGDAEVGDAFTATFHYAPPRNGNSDKRRFQFRERQS